MWVFQIVFTFEDSEDPLFPTKEGDDILENIEVNLLEVLRLIREQDT